MIAPDEIIRHRVRLGSVQQFLHHGVIPLGDVGVQLLSGCPETGAAQEMRYQVHVLLTRGHDPPMTLQASKLLEVTVDNRPRIHAKPLIQDGGIGGTEIVIELQIAVELVFRFQRRVLTVHATFDGAADEKRHPTGAVVATGAVVPNAAAKLREHQHQCVLLIAVISQVRHERAHAIRHVPPQTGMRGQFAGMGVPAAERGVIHPRAEIGEHHLGDTSEIL